MVNRASHQPPDMHINNAFRVTSEGAGHLTRSQSRGDSFVRPSRGVRYAADTADPWLAQTSAAVMASRPGAALTDISAAALWDLPLPPWLRHDLTAAPRRSVAVLPGGAHPSRDGVRGRRLRMPAGHVTENRGIRCTTASRTWIDCAALLPTPHLVAMGDAILARELASPGELEDMVRWAHGRRGVVSARRALPILDPAAESPAESLVRAHIVLTGLPRPESNVDIYAGGRWIARVDLCWREQRLILEYDGAVHLGDKQRRRDAVRRNELQQAGWLVITLTADDLRRPARMVDQIARLLAERTPTPPSGELWSV